MHGVEQLFGDAGPLEHRAHEDEKRHGGEDEVRRNRLDLLRELEEDRVAEGVDAEGEGHAQQRHRHRKAEKKSAQRAPET